MSGERLDGGTEREWLEGLRPEDREPETAQEQEQREQEAGEFVAMVKEMRDPDAKKCECGFPGKPCLRVMLKNGPPYPPRPCEPVNA